jgi:hypothetical protein
MRGVHDPQGIDDVRSVEHGVRIGDDRPISIDDDPSVGGEHEAASAPHGADEVCVQDDLSGVIEVVGDEHVGDGVQLARGRRPELVPGRQVHVGKDYGSEIGEAELKGFATPVTLHRALRSDGVGTGRSLAPARCVDKLDRRLDEAWSLIAAGGHVIVHEARTWVWGAVIVSLTVLTSCDPGSTSAAEAPTPTRPVIMLVGDSVPEQLADDLVELADARGWDVVSAAEGACPVTGETPSTPEGRLVHVEKNCPGVPAVQDEMIRANDPDVVVWWDRFDLVWFKAGGDVIAAGTKRFDRIRERRTRAAMDRLGVDGARVVFVAVEPTGVGVKTSCEAPCDGDFTRLKLDHYGDIIIPWNRRLRAIAATRHSGAGFVSVTNVICHPIPVVRIPCNDKINGVPARLDGTHFRGDGITLVGNGLLDRLAPFMPVT